jgi:hypothetical protein
MNKQHIIKYGFIGVGWICFLCILLTYFFFILPGKGFDFTDHGYYLYTGFAHVLNTQPLDTLTALRPGSMLNGFFMLLGIRNYLSLSMIFISLLPLSAAVLLTGLNNQIVRTLYFPLTLSIVTSCFYASLASYQNIPPTFLGFALGFFFLSCDAKSKLAHLFFVNLASFFFILTGFSNIPLLPVTITSCGLLAFLFHKKINLTYFIISLFIFAILITVPYLQLVLHVNWITSENQTYLANAITQATPAIKWLFISAIFALILRSTFTILHLSLHKDALFYISFFFASIIYLTIDLPINFTFFVFILSWCCIICFHTKSKTNQRILITAMIISVHFLEQSATTGSILMFTMYGGLWVVLLTSCIYQTCHTNQISKFVFYFNAALLVLLLANGVAIQISTAYRSEPPITPGVYIHDESFLKGLKIVQDKKTLIFTLSNIYNQYDCKNKIFLALTDQPLLYYYFSRISPTGASWEPGSILKDLNEKELVNELHRKNHWCAFITPGNRGHEEWNHSLPILQPMLKKESLKIISVETPPSKAPQSYPHVYQIYIK